MGVVSFPQVASGLTIDQLADLVARMIKEVEWLANGNVDSHNVRNLAGFNVDRYLFKHESGIVGLSGADPTNPAAVRIWAGLADMLTAPFRVTQDGSGFASNFTIEGGVIRTAAPGNRRIELSGGIFRGIAADGSLSGLEFNPSVTDIVDIHIYHLGAQLLTFFDNIDSITIQPGANATSLKIGDSANLITTYALGPWNFSQKITGSIQNADHATLADTVTTIPVLSGGVSSSGNSVTIVTNANLTGDVTSIGNATTISSGVITDAKVSATAAINATKIGSGTTTNTELGYVHGVTSAIQTQLDGKASKTPGSWQNPTLQNSWITVNTVSYRIDDMGIVRFRGAIQNGTTAVGTLLFTLPLGFRPTQGQRLSSIAWTSDTDKTSIFLSIDTSGNVTLGLSAKTSVALDGLTFPTT